MKCETENKVEKDFLRYLDPSTLYNIFFFYLILFYVNILENIYIHVLKMIKSK